MVSIFLPAAFILLFSFAQANLIPRVTTTPTIPTFSYTNSSTTRLSRTSSVTGKCCFVVQDTVSEEWWQMTKTVYGEVNLTSITTFITKFPNGTSKPRFETNVYTTNLTTSSTRGYNPITNYLNSAAGPVETTIEHTGSDPIVTGGVTIHSPAAFYVYNSVKIITVDAVTDDSGNLQCAVATQVDDGGAFFRNQNSNAQAYFGGSSIVGMSSTPTATITSVVTSTLTTTLTPADAASPGPISTITTTITQSKAQYMHVYTDRNGNEVINSDKPTGTVISLVTPFIYAPERGAHGKTIYDYHCDVPSGTENYGYIPQTLLDFLIQNKQYSAQYPGLENCIGGGPSVIPGQICGFTQTSLIAVGGDLTESTVVYVTPPGIKPEQGAPTPPPVAHGGKNDPNNGKPPGNEGDGSFHPEGEGDHTPGNKKPDPPPKEPGNGGGSHEPENNKPGSSPKEPENNGGSREPENNKPGSPPKEPENNGGSHEPEINKPGSPPKPPSSDKPKSDVKNNDPIGDMINSIIGGPPKAAPAVTPGPEAGRGNPIVISGPTEIPVDNALPGVTGNIKTVGGKPVFVIPGPTTFPALPLAPSGAEHIGSKTDIGGNPFVVIQPTRIPLSDAPKGIAGASTTTVNGVPFVVVPSAVTYAAPSSNGAGSIGSSTMIHGVPFVVVPGPTKIPLSEAPKGLSGATTEINGVPYLIIPSKTTVAASGETGSLGRTTLIDGIPFVVIPGPTTVPVKDAPKDLQNAKDAKTTLINGTPYLVIPSKTTVAAPGETAPLGSTTLIDGTPFVVIPGPTTIPAKDAPKDLKGAKTTMIDGTPYLVVPSKTTVELSPTKTGESAGELTVIIDGSSRLIIAGPTTMPINPKFPMSGKTTVIDGTTMVEVSAKTTVAAKKTSSSSTSTSTSTNSITPSVTPTPTSDDKEPGSSGNRMMELNACVMALVLGSMMLVLFA